MRTLQRTTSLMAVVSALLLVGAGCSGDPAGQQPRPVGASNHRWFPLTAGTTHEFGKMTVNGAIGCESCHRPSADSFTKVKCDHCHKHTEAITQRLHLGLPASFTVDTSSTNDPDEKAELRGASCYGCHPTGEKRAFSHTLITGNCAECHAPNNAFAALPKPGFTHQDIGATDCSACHVTTAWSPASSVPSNVSDPTRNLMVNALQPTWSATSIVAVTPDPQIIPMTMNHAATAVDAGVLAECTNCHAQADQGQFYPGVMHWSLTNLGVPQPTHCNECHGVSGPRGFVGALDPARSPSTGEMKHDAVLWANEQPTATPVVTAGCVTCHQAPNEVFDATWKFANGRDDGGAVFHRSLTESALPQPTACLDCHANTRPVTPVAAPNFTFDHTTTLGECAGCHTSTTQWSGGKYHSATAPAPTTCLPCHASERPTSTTGWQGNYAASPFDYGTNANGVGHGADQDCVVCHAGPGTGTWGTNQNWQGGNFGHAATSVAATTCIDCHTTQRPDLLMPAADAGFDHAASGTGDCLGCHQATVTRGSYVNLLPIPGGDWRGGQTYPGATLISTPNQSVRVQSTLLTRAGQRVTAMTTSTVTLPNAFLHTSSTIPAAVFPGSATMPDMGTCWHCHTSTGTTVTAYANGRFHSALTNHRTSPDAGITALPQPTSCNDCHRTMRPPNIVSKPDAGAWLLPMDHAAAFMGGSVTGVPAMDCGSCHRTPGLGPTQWSDGQFHRNTPSGAQPTECVNCHWPLMTLATADVTFPDAGTPSTFTMKHRSGTVTTHACASCHTTALNRSTMTPATTLWRPGTYHPQASPQPTACLDCHSASSPTLATQGTVVYTLPQGGTATNGAQWMNHGDATLTGRDCALCHASDARTSGSAWNKATPYHSKVTGVTSCAKCHGLTNGRGTTVGTNNNMPAGLIDTATTTTSSASPGVKDQIAHTDSNVTRMDCAFCHTQIGPSTVMGVQGKEWSVAGFHRKFTSGNPLVINGTTGRCSNCHLNVKPGPAYTQHDHSAYTATSATDCSSCHSWPGTSPTTPNWLGATGGHASSGPTAGSMLDCNTCHGLNGSSAKHLTVAAASHYGGISNGNSCTSCHINFAGFKDTVTNLKYAHTNATANAGNGCANCHVFTAQLLTTLTNTPSLTYPTVTGGHQFSQTRSVTGSFDGDTFTAAHTAANLARCGSCHQYATTTATTNIWTFRHRPSNPGITGASSKSAARNVIGCNMCH